jgi:hypothetical protein
VQKVCILRLSANCVDDAPCPDGIHLVGTNWIIVGSCERNDRSKVDTCPNATRAINKLFDILARRNIAEKCDGTVTEPTLTKLLN